MPCELYRKSWLATTEGATLSGVYLIKTVNGRRSGESHTVEYRRGKGLTLNLSGKRTE